MPGNKEIYSSAPRWPAKVSNVHQLGGIELSILHDGPGRGTRIAWINTGTGFRYKVVIDRGMDIADAFFNHHSLAWISHGGTSYPQPFSSHGTDWLRTFGGGLLVTCGLSHVGAPETDAYGERGQHGLISNTPAQIESVIQPDLLRGNMQMSITGIMKQTQIFGPSLELRRTISGTLGEPFLSIQDEVVNSGNTPAAHMMLYHFNLGWPLIDEGTALLWNGDLKLMGEEKDNPIFNAQHDYKKCPAPMNEHRANGQAAAFIDIQPDAEGNCICGVHNHELNLALALRFRKEQLPWLTNWQHWAPGEYVVGLEPCTNPPVGQSMARKQGELLFIEPGSIKKYDLKLELFHDPGEIGKFVPYFK